MMNKTSSTKSLSEHIFSITMPDTTRNGYTYRALKWNELTGDERHIFKQMWDSNEFWSEDGDTWYQILQVAEGGASVH